MTTYYSKTRKKMLLSSPATVRAGMCLWFLFFSRFLRKATSKFLAGPDGPNDFRIHKGMFVLPYAAAPTTGHQRNAPEVAIRVAVSYALATSIKLDSLESQIEDTIKATQAIPEVGLQSFFLLKKKGCWNLHDLSNWPSLVKSR